MRCFLRRRNVEQLIANAKRGRVAQAVGASFESWLEGQHTLAKRYGILAHVEKTQARTAWVKGRLEYVGKGVADYIGTLEGGRSFALEAKSTSGEYLPKSEIDTKQAEHLQLVALAGGLALLLVEFRSDEHPYWRRYAVPWLEVPWEVARTAQRVVQDKIEKWRVINECYLQSWHMGGLSSGAHITLRKFARE